MKLRNLLFGTMIACAFVACSNDDDPNPTPTEAPDAYLNIAVNAKIIGSKAVDGDDNAKTGETTINNLTIAVFNAATGELIGYRRSTAGKEADNFTKTGTSYKFNSPVKTKAVQVKAYVLANVPDATLSSAKNLGDYEEALASLSDQKVGDGSNGLTMSTTLQTSTNALVASTAANPNLMGEGASVENAVTGCTGDILLQRVAARVQIGKVYSSTYKGKEQLAITGVYMFNVRSNSRLLNAATGSLDFRKDTEKQLFEAGDITLAGDLKVASETLSGNDLLKVDYTQAVVIDSKTNSEGTGQTLSKASFYVMANDLLSKDTKSKSAYTLISVKGKYTSPEGVTMASDRWYTVIVGLDGAGEGADGRVVRNTVYDVATLDLTGSGSDSPFTPESAAYLNATVKITPWSYVIQNASVD